jgi:histidinol-phosphate aminotransferase
MLPPFTIQPREEVQAIHAYKPPLGGRRSQTRLDFNENTRSFPEYLPHGIPLKEVAVYPEYDALIEALAKHLHVDTSCLSLTNGSDEAIAVIPQTFVSKGDKVLLSQPSFPLIGHSMTLAGADITWVTALPKTFHYDLEGITLALATAKSQQTPFKLAMFASPDNPTGATIPHLTLAQWLKNHPETLFVMDEAYYEYTGDTALPLLATYSNLLVTRTFSKAWGLAGLRIGYVLGHPQAIAYLHRVKSPYSVNALSVWLAQQLLPHASRVLADAQQLMQSKKALVQTLEATFKLTIVPGKAHFFLIRLGILEAQRIVQFLKHTCQLLIRDRSADVSLQGYVRANAGNTEENTLLCQGLAEYRLRHALIFDLDDTLVDTSKSFDAVVADLMAHYAPHHTYTHETLQALRDSGGFNDDWMATQALLEKLGIHIPLEAIAQEGTSRYLAIAKETETLMIPTSWLATLQQRYRLMIVTGRRRQEYEAVWSDVLDPFFDEVVCVDDPKGLQPKPSPDGLMYLIQKYELRHAYYIGNSVDDILSGVQANAQLQMHPALQCHVTPIGVEKTTAHTTLLQAGASHVWRSIASLEDAFGL